MTARTQAALKARVRRALKRNGLRLRIEPPRVKYHIIGDFTGSNFGHYADLKKLARVLKVRT